MKTFMSRSPKPLHLARGSTRLMHVEAGSVLVSLDAAVQIDDAQRWLAERLWTPAIRLEAGDAHGFDSGGWVRVSASADADIVLVSPAEEPYLVPSIKRIIRRCRVAFGHAAFS